MSKREACAWCGATDQLMVRLKQGTPVNACVDWQACGEREAKKNAPKELHLEATFGRQRKNEASLFGRPTTLPVPG
jgi:hypothetical protein